MFYESGLAPSVDELRDANISSPSNGDALVRNGDTWRNSPVAPKNHASSGTEYGVASSSDYGHVKLGTASGTACEGNDSRLSDKREPTAHASANGSTYGRGTKTNFGHVKLSDTFEGRQSQGGASDGMGASQYALADAYSVLDAKTRRIHGTILCVGDSWGEGVGAGSGQGWPNYLAAKLGKSVGTSKDNVVISVKGGTGMANPVNGIIFEDLVQEGYNRMSADARTDTTLVIVAGGANDRGYDAATLCGKTISCIRKAKLLFPNADVFVFNVSGSMTTHYIQAIDIEEGYSSGVAYENAAYGNITNIIKTHGECASANDLLHLNANGYNLVAGWMISYLLGVKPTSSNATITIRSALWPGYELEGGYVQPLMMARATNDSVSIYAYQTSLYITGTTPSQQYNPRPVTTVHVNEETHEVTPIYVHDWYDSWYYWLGDWHIDAVDNAWGYTSLFRFCDNSVSQDWSSIQLQGGIIFNTHDEHEKWVPATFHLTFITYGTDPNQAYIRVRVSCLDCNGGGWIHVPEGTSYAFVIGDGRAELPVEAC